MEVGGEAKVAAGTSVSVTLPLPAPATTRAPGEAPAARRGKLADLAIEHSLDRFYSGRWRVACPRCLFLSSCSDCASHFRSPVQGAVEVLYGPGNQGNFPLIGVEWGDGAGQATIANPTVTLQRRLDNTTQASLTITPQVPIACCGLNLSVACSISERTSTPQ